MRLPTYRSTTTIMVSVNLREFCVVGEQENNTHKAKKIIVICLASPPAAYLKTHLHARVLESLYEKYSLAYIHIVDVL